MLGLQIILIIYCADNFMLSRSTHSDMRSSDYRNES